MGQQICAGLHVAKLSSYLHNPTLALMSAYTVKLCNNINFAKQAI